MSHQKTNRSQGKSVWQKIKTFIAHLTSHHQQSDDDSDTEEGSGDSGVGKLQGQGFLDPKAATQKDLHGKIDHSHVKNLETILYDELKKDPAAMKALKDLVNGQIPTAEATEAYERVRNSEVALQTIANSEYAPSDIKAKAREELANQQRKKLAAQPGFTPERPKPRGM